MEFSRLFLGRYYSNTYLPLTELTLYKGTFSAYSSHTNFCLWMSKLRLTEVMTFVGAGAQIATQVCTHLSPQPVTDMPSATLSEQICCFGKLSDLQVEMGLFCVLFTGSSASLLPLGEKKNIYIYIYI